MGCGGKDTNLNWQKIAQCGNITIVLRSSAKKNNSNPLPFKAVPSAPPLTQYCTWHLFVVPYVSLDVTDLLSFVCFCFSLRSEQLLVVIIVFFKLTTSLTCLDFLRFQICGFWIWEISLYINLFWNFIFCVTFIFFFKFEE